MFRILVSSEWKLDDNCPLILCSDSSPGCIEQVTNNDQGVGTPSVQYLGVR